MKGLHPGDTLAIRSGFYEKGGSFSNLSHITIINYGGLLDFGQYGFFGNLSQVSISGNGVKDLMYGIRFQNMKGNAFFWRRPAIIYRLHFVYTATWMALPWMPVIFLPAIPAIRQRWLCIKPGSLIRSYCIPDLCLSAAGPPPTSFQNVVDSIAFLNIIIDSTNSEVYQVIGQFHLPDAGRSLDDHRSPAQRQTRCRYFSDCGQRNVAEYLPARWLGLFMADLECGSKWPDR